MNARAMISSALSRLHREEAQAEWDRATAARQLADHEQRLGKLRRVIAEIRERRLAEEL